MKFLFAKSRVLLHSLSLCGFLALAITFFWFFINGQLSFIWDTREFGFINLNMVTGSLVDGNFPLWNSFNFSGYPYMGDIESGMFYPINWLFSWIFGAVSFSELVYYFVFHFFLGAVFAYILAYKLTKNVFASALAGVVYAYSGYALGHISHLGQVVMYMWVPLIFWGYILMFERIAMKLRIFGKVFYMLLAGLIFGTAILVGHSNTTIYVLLGLVILTIYELCVQIFGGKKNLLERIFVTGVSSLVATIFAFMVAAILVLPVLEFAGQSNRTELTYEQQSKGWSLMPKNLMGIFNPNYDNVLSGKFKGSVDITQNYFYIGLLPVLFGVCFLFYSKNKYKWFWIIFAGVSLAAAFPEYLLVNRWLFDYFPGFNKARMAVQIMGMVFLAGSMIVAMGAKNLAEKFSDKLMKKESMFFLKRAVLVLLTALFLFLIPFDIFYHGFNRRFYSEEVNSEKVFDLPEELALISQLKSGVGTGKIQSQSYENDPFRIADEKNTLMQNKWEYYRMENVWGNGGIKIKKYNDLFERQGRMNWEVVNDNLYDFLNAKYIFTTRRLLPPNHFQKIEFGDKNFYLNKKVLPRAYFVKNFIVEPDEQKQLNLIKDGKVDFQKEVLLENEPVYYGSDNMKYALELAKVSPVNILERRAGYLKLFVHNSEDAILVLSEVDYPGWKLFVDGKEQKYFTANYVFRAVPLTGGQHEVEFRFEPKSFYWGSYVSVFSVILFIMSGLFYFYYRKND